jgi:hypothetical protein
MRTRTRLAVVASITVCALALAIQAATANRIEFSTQGWRIVFANFTIHYEVIPIRCPLTLEGSFHSRVTSKTFDSLIGYITRAIFQTPCENTTVVALNATLPWHEQWNNFSGTLPSITGVGLFMEIQYLVFLFETSCLYGATSGNLAGTRLTVETSGRVTSVTQNLARATRISGGSSCPTNVSWESGGGGITALGQTAAIALHLVS